MTDIPNPLSLAAHGAPNGISHSAPPATQGLLAPYASSSDASGIAIGPQLPFELLTDPGGRLDAETVAQLDASAFTLQHRPLSLGYTSAVSWVRFVPPPQRGKRYPKKFGCFTNRNICTHIDMI